jgi:hypothetical protein
MDLEEAKRNLERSTDLHLKASWSVVYGPALIAEVEALRLVAEAAKELECASRNDGFACPATTACWRGDLCAALAAYEGREK